MYASFSLNSFVHQCKISYKWGSHANIHTILWTPWETFVVPISTVHQFNLPPNTQYVCTELKSKSKHGASWRKDANTTFKVSGISKETPIIWFTTIIINTNPHTFLKPRFAFVRKKLKTFTQKVQKSVCVLRHRM